MATGREHLFSTLDQFNKKRFRSPEAIQIFNRFATYNGSNPYQAPGMLSLIPHLEFNEGVYYPEGGMYSITEALYQLALKTGVRFHFHSPVGKILVSGARVKGLEVCGENKEYDIVISNLDVYFTYRDLLHRPVDAERVLRSERSSSALIFYWGINRTFPDLDLHNIFFSEDYPAEFDHLFRLKSPYEDPTVYINITAKMEAGHAPAGKENWFVMVNAPAVQVPDQQAQIQTARHCILEKLSRMLGIPVADHLETEAVLTPGLIESRTGSYLGSLYGTSSNSPWAAFLRHPNFSRRISGLYFAGGSVHPGGGIPLCLRSARIVSGQVPNPQPH
jgi:phytoene desaturase